MLLNYHIWDNVIRYICFFESVYILFSKLLYLRVLTSIVTTQNYGTYDSKLPYLDVPCVGYIYCM